MVARTTYNWSKNFAYYVRIWLSLILLVASVCVSAEPTNCNSSTLDLYIRDGCPHCADAKLYLPKLLKQYPQVELKLHSVDKNPLARDELIKLSKKAGVWPPGVPTFVFQCKLHVGFDSPENSAPDLHRLIGENQSVTKPFHNKWLGFINLEQLGLPMFTIALGLVDGFNPCAMWVLLFLLTLLVRLKNRKRMALIAATFVLVSGLVYYAFMAAWLNIFLLVGFSTIIRATLGLVALTIGAINVRDFFTNNKRFTLSIPDAAKPGIYARVRHILRVENLATSLIGVILLAIVVNFIELLCTAGIPAIYTAILTQQDLSNSTYYGYLGLYILGYIADDALMVTIAVLTLSSSKLTQSTGRWLKFVSGIAISILGILLLVNPGWLI